MVELKGTSWQQRYSTNEIFTLRCKLMDKPGMFSNLSSAVGRVDGHIGDIKLIDLEDGYKIRDVTVYLKSEKELEELLSIIKKTDGLSVVSVKNEILETHRRGAIDVVSRVPIKSLTDLRMVYTPGVAKVCQSIVEKPLTAWEMTGLCDRVAIVTNGTAVLGLGDIGVVGSLPVMEGKAAIFAEFVNISAFPILIDTKDIDTFVDTVVRIAPGFGAIQLEDVAAPACFEIEAKLREKLNIPVFHDDQHGTSTIVLAALINAINKTGKKKENCSVIMLGAGAAGIAISKILLEFGIGDVVVYDSTGAVYRGREEKMNPYKEQLAKVTNKNNENSSLKDGFTGKDIFIGVSRPNMVSKEMIAAMNSEPIVLPLSNPVGEITKEEALAAGAAITADGRDINNALAYPAIFRGALDARATEINLKMQLAASQRIAELAPPDSLLPDILDKSIHSEVARAVADAWVN
ncbi:MAG: malic enzyme-like NAD(P)-binding protein [Planctomycetota bacterium]|jgi:malate dehydrogenase (oxaloacetate-decarboxylating)